MITTVPELTLKDVKERVTTDSIIATKILGIADDEIEKCFRAGQPLGTGSNKDRTSPGHLFVCLPSLNLQRASTSTGMAVKLLSTECSIGLTLTYQELNAELTLKPDRRDVSVS